MLAAFIMSYFAGVIIAFVLLWLAKLALKASHILPNIVGVIIALASLAIGNICILTLATAILDPSSVCFAVDGCGVQKASATAGFIAILLMLGFTVFAMTYLARTQAPSDGNKRQPTLLG